jgi:hypothetical protein
MEKEKGKVLLNCIWETIYKDFAPKETFPTCPEPKAVPQIKKLKGLKQKYFRG